MDILHLFLLRVLRIIFLNSYFVQGIYYVESDFAGLILLNRLKIIPSFQLNHPLDPLSSLWLKLAQLECHVFSNSGLFMQVIVHLHTHGHWSCTNQRSSGHRR
jgi:hypothetical protein